MSSAAGLFMAGYVRAGVDQAVRAARADPTSIYKALGVVRRYAAAGDMAEASEQFGAVEAIWPGHPDLNEHRRRLAVELGRAEEIGRAHDRTPITNTHRECGLLL